MNNKMLATISVVMVVLLTPAVVDVAFAQYMGNIGTSGETGSHTLEETLQLARDRINYADANPATGSGTPYLAADGILGAMAIAGAVFGGIAIAFFAKAKGGKYYAIGRGK